MTEYTDCLGYLKYTGKTVEGGFLDARKSAQALTGLDEVVRFLAIQQDPKLRFTDYEFPVKVQKGSWQVLIHETLDLLKLGVGIAGTAYAAQAAKSMAENDFKDIGFKDIIKNSLHGMQWLIKIGKHLGGVTEKKFKDVKFKDDNNLIGIKNAEGDYLYIPKIFYKFYISSNPTILKKIAEIVDDERKLVVGVIEDGFAKEETIDSKYRHNFTLDCDDDDDVVLPELQDGQIVELTGELTRGNERANTFGFSYKNHILLCIPSKGSIVRFKPALFLRCTISGTISRRDEKGMLSNKNPKIIFTNIEKLEGETNSPTLFD